MIHLSKENTDDRIIVTLNEKKTISYPTYKFSCTNIATNKVVEFQFLSTDDLSDYPDRYNEFSLNTSIVFADAPSGQWQYVVTEVETNIEVENGKMNLFNPTNYNVSGYELETTFKGYGG